MNIAQISTKQDLYRQALDLRYDLFFKEFDLPKGIEKDELEESSLHLGMISNNDLLAYARVTEIGLRSFKISQVVVRSAMQRRGYGKAILRSSVELAKSLGAKNIELNSQVSARGFYESLGFRESGAHYLSRSTGVPHVKMLFVCEPSHNQQNQADA